MGHDSRQAEQRRPYLRAKAGIALAGWPQVRTREISIKETLEREEANVAKLRIRKRLETCMAGLLSIQIKILILCSNCIAANLQYNSGLTMLSEVNPTTEQSRSSSTI